MAKVDFEKIKRLNKERYVLQEEVEATYSVFEKEGEKFLQIETYGRDSRELKGKPSQIIQVNKASAEALIKLLEKELL